MSRNSEKEEEFEEWQNVNARIFGFDNRVPTQYEYRVIQCLPWTVTFRMVLKEWLNDAGARIITQIPMLVNITAKITSLKSEG